MLRIAVVLLLLVCLAFPVWAAADDTLNSAALRQRLDSLLMVYTEEHPDVIYTRRLLEKAEAMEAEKQAAREARRRAQKEKEQRGDEMNHYKE